MEGVHGAPGRCTQRLHTCISDELLNVTCSPTIGPAHARKAVLFTQVGSASTNISNFQNPPKNRGGQVLPHKKWRRDSTHASVSTVFVAQL